MSTAVFKTPHWDVFLAEDQSYFGRLTLVSRNPRQSLGELTLEEQQDFFQIAGRLEKFFKKEFRATMFNWSCLMNNAYRAKETPHVHWHFRPRYAKSIVVEGKTYSDPNFGYHYVPSTLGVMGSISKSAEKKLRDKLKAYFTIS